MKEIEASICYEFSNKKLLETALTHSSVISEHPEMKSNETLEFLGDSVVQLVVSEHLFENFPSLDEGELSKKRSAIVCGESLAIAGRKISLPLFIHLGKGEQTTGGDKKDNIIADAFEALCAAMYLDGGYEKTRIFILNCLSGIIEDVMDGRINYDYKSSLQEFCQGNLLPMPEYTLQEVIGPEHDATFVMSVTVGENKEFTSSGHNKKNAQQNAAKEALLNLAHKN